MIKNLTTHSSNSLFRLDLETKTWEHLNENYKGKLPSPRCCHSSISLDPFIIILFGGTFLHHFFYQISKLNESHYFP